MKIGIIGLGWVGTSVAMSTLHSGLVTELLLHDIHGELAEGEAMDFSHGAPFYPSAQVRAVELEAMKSADAVVIAAGRGGRPEESRLDLVRDNARIVRGIAENFRGFRGILVVVTNPVDVLTLTALEASGLSPARVIGTGTMLDTARLRHAIGNRLNLDPRAIHAQVVGEHGDSEVVLWTGARIGGVTLQGWPGWDRAGEATLAESVRKSAYEVIRRKGATNHAIGLVTAHLLKWMLRGEHRVLTVTRLQEGACGLRDVGLSLPTVVGREGAGLVVEPEMSPEERERLHRSAEILRGVLASLRG